ncbi:MAG: enoyl-CoA hydratase [Hyphomicrobiaceae bacterium]|nr:enoyl-CoA hydratase [Hyphomicrobiaceae bacterium]
MLDIATTDEKLIGRKDGPVGHVIFNNPAKHNAVSLDMWETMSAVMDDFIADDDIRVLVVTGAGGKAFVSGADISKFESERATKEAVAAYSEASRGAYDKLYNFAKPTVARIEGYCIGGGANLAMCCDLRICNESARFAIPAAKLGLGYGYDGLKRLSDIVGVSRAMEMFYTARQFSAQEAYDMGLVNAAVPDDQLDETVDGITKRIGENAPLTIAAIKRAAREITKDSEDRDLKTLEAMVQACFDSEDYIEGRRAFMEKRKPEFKGH